MKKILRDAIHGDIELNALEVELIDTPEFQRLREIKQLGTAHLVYPSATHTRFEHSIGTCWSANLCVEAIRKNYEVSDDEKDVIRIASLLHDVTHIPFGHTLEDERRVLPRHDHDPERLDYFLRSSAIGTILGRVGICEEVCSILTNQDDWLSDIVRGPISADLLDYIRRDTYFCGLSQHYDDRIYKSFSVEDKRLVINLNKNDMLRRDVLSELINLLRIRYTLSERVYFHHTKLASGAMISKAVELALELGFSKKKLMTLGDQTLIWSIREKFQNNHGIQSILGQMESRQLYKPCFLLTVSIGKRSQRKLVSRFHESESEREACEISIAKAVGLDHHQIIVYCPSIGMSLPEAEVPVRIPENEICPLSSGNNSEIRILKNKHRDLWTFLVLIDRSRLDRLQIARAAAEEYFGIKSEV